jgi:hypothetical protein
MGLTISLRAVGAYLLFLVPVVAILLPVLLPDSPPSNSAGIATRLLRQTRLQIASLSLLSILVVASFILSMPAILAAFSVDTVAALTAQAKSYPWNGHVRYFGQPVSAQSTPWHYVFGFMLVQLPLYYHAALITIVFAAIFSWRETTSGLKVFAQNCDKTCYAVLLLLLALAMPLALVLATKPVLYNNIRHLTFLIPLVCLLIFFGLVWALRNLPVIARAILIVAIFVLWIEPVAAMIRLHPYQYIYYNPLVKKPVRDFQLDYWATSLRELAEKLNVFADQLPDRKLRVYFCNHTRFLIPYVDPAKVELVGKKGNPDVYAGLYPVFRKCLKPLSKKHNFVVQVAREGSILAVAAMPN